MEILINEFINYYINGTTFNLFYIPIDIYKEYNYDRLITLFQINNIFQKHIHKKIDNYIERIINIEKGCYDKVINDSYNYVYDISWDDTKFKNLYYIKISKLLKNLDPDSEVNNNYLLNKLINNDIDPLHVGNLSAIELCPDKSKKILNLLYQKNNQKLETRTSQLYKCNNCHKRNTKITQFQGRALDESSTISIECIECGKCWCI